MVYGSDVDDYFANKKYFYAHVFVKVYITDDGKIDDFHYPYCLQCILYHENMWFCKKNNIEPKNSSWSNYGFAGEGCTGNDQALWDSKHFCDYVNRTKIYEDCEAREVHQKLKRRWKPRYVHFIYNTTTEKYEEEFLNPTRIPRKEKLYTPKEVMAFYKRIDSVRVLDVHPRYNKYKKNYNKMIFEDLDGYWY